MNHDQREHSLGFTAGVAAFTMWGLLPLYLKPLHAIDATTIISHRVIWGCVFVLAWMAFKSQLGTLWQTLRKPALIGRLTVSALLISVNWLTYVWAISHGHVLDGSLGYFINPLLNVLIGVLFLSERLNRQQWLAVAIAAVGVLWLTWLNGHLPWVALALAVSFATYGLLRKVTPVDAVTGLGVETLLLAPLGLAWLFWQHQHPPADTATLTPFLMSWLVLSGLVTALPLALFATAAKHLPYSTLGLLQYLAPTLQLLCGLLAFKEDFPPARALGFSLIWLALIIYATDGYLRVRRNQAAAAGA